MGFASAEHRLMIRPQAFAMVVSIVEKASLDAEGVPSRATFERGLRAPGPGARRHNAIPLGLTRKIDASSSPRPAAYDAVVRRRLHPLQTAVVSNRKLIGRSREGHLARVSLYLGSPRASRQNTREDCRRGGSCAVHSSSETMTAASAPLRVMVCGPRDGAFENFTEFGFGFRTVHWLFVIGEPHGG